MSTNLTRAGSDAPLPATYEAAQRALAECSRIDECKGWADKAQALASYARQAKDTTMHSLALRIQNRAMRRAGELLKQVPRGDEATRFGQDGTVPPVNRTQAASDAGLSERQRKTAMRVANVPTPAFERAVESSAPPTVSQMAQMGTDRRVRADVSGDESAHFRPSDSTACLPENGISTGNVNASNAARLLRDLAAFCGTHDANAVAVAAQDPDLMRGFVETIDRWLDRFVTSLRDSDGRTS